MLELHNMVSEGTVVELSQNFIKTQSVLHKNSVSSTTVELWLWYYSVVWFYSEVVQVWFYSVLQ